MNTTTIVSVVALLAFAAFIYLSVRKKKASGKADRKAGRLSLIRSLKN